MDESQFTKSLLSGIDRVRDDGIKSDITFDGAGPVRFTPNTAKEFDPSMYIFQVSVRNKRRWVPQFVHQLMASSYLLSLIPSQTWWSMTALPTVYEDLSIAYDTTGKEFTSTFMCFKESDCDLEPIVQRLTEHYRLYAYSETNKACWQVFSTLTSFPGNVCFEYNCPDSALFQRELAHLDEKNKQDCPSWVRYYNVPSFWAPSGREYFTNYDELVEWKHTLDPNQTLNRLSGV